MELVVTLTVQNELCQLQAGDLYLKMRIQSLNYILLIQYLLQRVFGAPKKLLNCCAFQLKYLRKLVFVPLY